MPWWRAIAGTVPHVAREVVATQRELGVKAGPISAARELVFRAAALNQRHKVDVQ